MRGGRKRAERARGGEREGRGERGERAAGGRLNGLVLVHGVSSVEKRLLE
jgi:hypothetical protein